MRNNFVILGLLILILIVVTIFVIFAGNYMRMKKELNESMKSFSTLIESGNLDDLSLTIYYISPSRDTLYPYRVDDVIKFSNPIVIDGNRLKKHTDLFVQLNDAVLKPVIKKSYLNARIYYVFETEKEGNILDVAMWSMTEDSIFVNGIEVKPNDIFYDAILPFLSEGAAIRLEVYLGRRNYDELADIGDYP